MWWRRFCAQGFGRPHGMTQPWRFTVFQGEGLKTLCTGMPVWYQTAMEGREVSEAKMTKLRHR